MEALLCIILCVVVIFLAVLIFAPQGGEMCKNAAEQGVQVVQTVCKTVGK